MFRLHGTYSKDAGGCAVRHDTPKLPPANDMTEVGKWRSYPFVSFYQDSSIALSVPAQCTRRHSELSHTPTTMSSLHVNVPPSEVRTLDQVHRI
jgi:hypothetical protein